MEIRKITYGWVTQRWDETGKFLGQEFFAGDEVDFEDEDGQTIPADSVPEYRCFDMVQDPPIGESVTMI